MRVEEGRFGLSSTSCSRSAHEKPERASLLQQVQSIFFRALVMASFARGTASDDEVRTLIRLN